MEQFGAKDLYRVVMRATSNMKVGNRDVKPGEPLLYLDGAQMMAAAQSTGYVAARGGKHNLSHIIWEKSGDVNFIIQRGVMSSMGYALITNFQVLDLPVNDTVTLTKTEILTIDNYGKVFLSETPIGDKPIFIYLFKNKVIQEKIEYETIEDKALTFNEEYADSQIMIDYFYQYGEPAKEYRLGRDRFNGYLSMEARYYTMGESGLQYSNILYVPKMKIMSDIHLRVGEDVAGPTLSTFNIVAVSEDYRGDKILMRTLQLERDVDGM